MLDLFFSKDEYKKWAEYYWFHYGFKTVPVFGKIALNSPATITARDGYFLTPLDPPILDFTILSAPDWLELVLQYIDEKQLLVTGIACSAQYSNVFTVDFDDCDFFYYWQTLTKTKSFTTKTKRGFRYESTGRDG